MPHTQITIPEIHMAVTELTYEVVLLNPTSLLVRDVLGEENLWERFRHRTPAIVA
ncbi:hypothetical protein [Hymenobacter sp. AT01-02]|uniref:hypothetical protein n=1 Tax=Hymenobacter sp. AT01-02 TaxID=1571877 RepID=UPI000B1173E5|nr:hypothetical protein [Hymenobacter sp. AT01-02]